MSEWQLDVGVDEFDQAVLETSHNVLVLVDFWAPWCAPCRALKPILEKLASEYKGRFQLVKVNSDDNPELSTRFNVRGIPQVKAFLNGALVDEFSGALPESQIRTFINKLLPSPGEKLRVEAMLEYVQLKDAKRALHLLEQAAELDPQSDIILIDRAELLLDLARPEDAASLLSNVSSAEPWLDRLKNLQARIELTKAAAHLDDIPSLTRTITADPANLTVRHQLAIRYISNAQYPEALDQLLEIIRRDRRFNDEVARKSMLQLFSVLGSDHSLVSQYRKKLASLLN